VVVYLDVYLYRRMERERLVRSTARDGSNNTTTQK